MPLTIKVHNSHGDLIEVCGTFIPRSQHITDDGNLSIGGVCAWDTTKDRRSVIYETHVHAPLIATKALEASISRNDE
jgi:hypothetical protein